MVSSDRSSIDPTLLLPSPRAGYYLSPQVYRQKNVWRQLSDNDRRYSSAKLGMKNR